MEDLITHTEITITTTVEEEQQPIIIIVLEATTILTDHTAAVLEVLFSLTQEEQTPLATEPIVQTQHSPIEATRSTTTTLTKIRDKVVRQSITEVTTTTTEVIITAIATLINPDHIHHHLLAPIIIVVAEAEA